MAAPSPPPPPTPPPPRPTFPGHGSSPMTPARPQQPLLTPSALARGAPLLLTDPAASSSAASTFSPLTGIYINQHVPITLTLNPPPPNFSQWRTLFEVMFQKYAITDHITDAARPGDAAWVQDDAHILSWLYTRVSPEIFRLVHQRGATAAEIWGAVLSLFMENAEHQVVLLATEFRRIEQGGASVIDYFGRLKECADRLADLGKIVPDRDQVLNMFRGLHPRLRYAIPILTMQTPFPTFLRCRAFLLLEESRLTPDFTHETALHAARAPPPPSSNSGNNNRCNGSGGGGGRNHGKGKALDNCGGSPHGGASSIRGPAPPAPVSTTPWTGMVHAWPMPWRPHAPGAGILGSRPGGPAPFAGAATHYGAPYPVAAGAPSPQWLPGVVPVPAHPPYSAPIGPGAAAPRPAWDQSALVHALNNLHVQQQQPPAPSAEWYLDSGASTHMASSSGMLSSSRPYTSSGILVGDGTSLAVTHTSQATLPTTTAPLALNDVLVSPHLIKNLISVKKLARENPVNVEFDDFGCSVKDRRTRRVIL
ncbi:uncharacterized protein [Aegilops tauschii subsp. strangulata]|uniref:uncharacterized protein n=1 Tax=Aegilops tauschii subsp. strangulata TaxID=200361 RepID=UPI000989F972